MADLRRIINEILGVKWLKQICDKWGSTEMNKPGEGKDSKRLKVRANEPIFFLGIKVKHWFGLLLQEKIFEKNCFWQGSNLRPSACKAEGRILIAILIWPAPSCSQIYHTQVRKINGYGYEQLRNWIKVVFRLCCKFGTLDRHTKENQSSPWKKRKSRGLLKNRDTAENGKFLQHLTR